MNKINFSNQNESLQLKPINSVINANMSISQYNERKWLPNNYRVILPRPLPIQMPQNPSMANKVALIPSSKVQDVGKKRKNVLFHSKSKIKAIWNTELNKKLLEYALNNYDRHSKSKSISWKKFEDAKMGVSQNAAGCQFTKFKGIYKEDKWSDSEVKQLQDFLESHNEDFEGVEQIVQGRTALQCMVKHYLGQIYPKNISVNKCGNTPSQTHNTNNQINKITEPKLPFILPKGYMPPVQALVTKKITPLVIPSVARAIQPAVPALINNERLQTHKLNVAIISQNLHTRKLATSKTDRGSQLSEECVKQLTQLVEMHKFDWNEIVKEFNETHKKMSPLSKNQCVKHYIFQMQKGAVEKAFNKDTKIKMKEGDFKHDELIIKFVKILKNVTEKDEVKNEISDDIKSMNWRLMNHFIGTGQIQFKERWDKILQPEIEEMKWSSKDTESLVLLVNAHSANPKGVDWLNIASEMPNHTPRQCMLHWLWALKPQKDD